MDEPIRSHAPSLPWSP